MGSVSLLGKGGDLMSAENKALVRRYFEAIDRGELALIDELFAPTYVRHDPHAPEVKGVEALKRHIRMVYTASPDLRHTIEDMVAEGDTVAARLTSRGTQTGDFQGIVPTGKQFTVNGMDLFRIVNGKIEEQWTNLDLLGVLQQLGAIPQ